MGGGMYTFVWLALAHAVADFYANYVPTYGALRECTPEQVRMLGLIVAISGIVGNALQPLAGFLGDKLGQKWIIVAGLLLAGLLCPSFTLFGFSMLAIGICSVVGKAGIAFFHPCAAALARRVWTRHKQLSISFFIVGGSLGFALSPWGFSTVLRLTGERWTFLLCVPALLLCPVLARVLPGGHGYEQAVSGTDLRTFLRERWRPLTAVYFAVVFRVFTEFSLVFAIPFICRERGYPMWTVEGGALFLVVLCSSGGMLLSGWLSTRFARSRVCILSMALSLVALLAFLLSPHVLGPGHLWLNLVLLGLGTGLAGAVNPLLVGEAQDIMPRFSGFLSACSMGAAWAVGSVAPGLYAAIAAWLYRTRPAGYASGYGHAMIITTFFLLPAMLCVMLLRRRR